MNDTKNKTEKSYPTESLLSSKALAGYHPDFATAILTKPAYTFRAATPMPGKYLKGGQT